MVIGKDVTRFVDDKAGTRALFRDHIEEKIATEHARRDADNRGRDGLIDTDDPPFKEIQPGHIDERCSVRGSRFCSVDACGERRDAQRDSA